MTHWSQLFSLRSRRALVTGSSRGIGLTIAQALAGAGAEVILNGRNVDSLAQAVATIRNAGGRAEAVCFDVADRQACVEAIYQIESMIGSIDILVNNAGLQHRETVMDFDESAFQELLDVHLLAPFRISRLVASRMAGRGAGKIINICSVLSAFSKAGVVPYSVAKAGLANLTRGMTAEWAPMGVAVNGIAPGYFRTEITQALSSDQVFNNWIESRVPMKRWGNLSELAGAVIFLASDAASFVNGHVLVVDGGLTATL